MEPTQPAGSAPFAGCLASAGRRAHLEEFDTLAQSITDAIRDRSHRTSATTWEYTILFTGSISRQDDPNAQGVLLVLSDLDTVDLPRFTFTLALREMGKKRWEVVAAFGAGDLERQYPLKDLPPMWDYMIDAALKQPPRGPTYACGASRAIDALALILKRQIIQESAQQLAAADPAGWRKRWGGLPARVCDNGAVQA